MSASDQRDFDFPLPASDDGAEGAFATGSVAVQCPPLDALGIQLERSGGYALRSLSGPGLAHDPEGEWRERVALKPDRPVYAPTGFVFRVVDGVLQARAAAPLRDRATAGPRLDDPDLELVPAARAAALQAISVGRGEVAAGLVLRHGQAASVQVLLEGRDPVAASVRGWWQALDEAGREDVSTRTLRAAVSVAETADELAEEAGAEDAGWLADVAALCRNRDDLHSAVRVMQRLAPEAVPRAALASADTALRGLLRSLYLPVPHTDAVMGLAAQQTACWWARSVGTPTPDDPTPTDEAAS
jgi:hypothetical protein